MPNSAISFGAGGMGGYWLGILAADPTAAELAAAGPGAWWFNTTLNNWRGWNGINVVIIG